VDKDNPANYTVLQTFQSPAAPQQPQQPSEATLMYMRSLGQTTGVEWLDQLPPETAAARYEDMKRASPGGGLLEMLMGPQGGAPSGGTIGGAAPAPVGTPQTSPGPTPPPIDTPAPGPTGGGQQLQGQPVPRKADGTVDTSKLNSTTVYAVKTKDGTSTNATWNPATKTFTPVQ
jgi:hypothetical protein